jgi:hypothetical protein
LTADYITHETHSWAHTHAKAYSNDSKITLQRLGLEPNHYYEVIILLLNLQRWWAKIYITVASKALQASFIPFASCSRFVVVPIVETNAFLDTVSIYKFSLEIYQTQYHSYLFTLSNKEQKHLLEQFF